MADGSSKPIDQVKVGDKITNAQPGSPATQADTVTAVHITYTDHDYDQLTIATPTGPATITSTAEHLYWDTTTHTWTPADNLNTGDQLNTPDNGHATILATKHYTATQTTYNLSVNDVHTYYVEAVNTPVLVHNCDGTVSSNGMSEEESSQAQGIVDQLGGHFEGQETPNMEGIDGYYDDIPASLKEINPAARTPYGHLPMPRTKRKKAPAKLIILGYGSS